MSNIQIYSGYKPFNDFKLTHNYYFYTHEINNKEFNISTGSDNNDIYQEKIITDGNIALVRMNHDGKYIIWHDSIKNLHDGISIQIKLEQANFFVNVITRNNELEYDIHLNTENEDLLSQILAFLRQHNSGLFDINQISLQYPSILITESFKGGYHTKDIEDFSPKVKKKRRRKY